MRHRENARARVRSARGFPLALAVPPRVGLQHCRQSAVRRGERRAFGRADRVRPGRCQRRRCVHAGRHGAAGRQRHRCGGPCRRCHRALRRVAWSAHVRARAHACKSHSTGARAQCPLRLVRAVLTSGWWCSRGLRGCVRRCCAIAARPFPSTPPQAERARSTRTAGAMATRRPGARGWLPSGRARARRATRHRCAPSVSLHGSGGRRWPVLVFMVPCTRTHPFCRSPRAAHARLCARTRLCPLCRRPVLGGRRVPGGRRRAGGVRRRRTQQALCVLADRILGRPVHIRSACPLAPHAVCGCALCWPASVAWRPPAAIAVHSRRATTAFSLEAITLSFACSAPHPRAHGVLPCPAPSRPALFVLAGGEPLGAAGWTVVGLPLARPGSLAPQTRAAGAQLEFGLVPAAARPCLAAEVAAFAFAFAPLAEGEDPDTVSPAAPFAALPVRPPHMPPTPPPPLPLAAHAAPPTHTHTHTHHRARLDPRAAAATATAPRVPSTGALTASPPPRAFPSAPSKRAAPARRTSRARAGRRAPSRGASCCSRRAATASSCASAPTPSLASR